MIWQSTIIMTIIDVLIVLIAGMMVWGPLSAKSKWARWHQLRGTLLILSGISLIALFYIVDLATMLVLPAMIGELEAMQVMTYLHLNVLWAVILVTLILISVGFMRHLHDRKRHEEAIQEKEEQLDNLLSNVGVVVLEGENFDINYVGGQVERILGYPKELWFADPGGAVGFWSKHLHPDDFDKIETCRHAIEIGNDHAFEYRMIAADGKEVWFYDTVTVESENGIPIKTRAVMLDITERKKAEEALRESEKRYQAIAEMSPVGIYHTDKAGNCIYVNEQWCIIAGITAEEAQGKGWIRSLHPEDRERVVKEWHVAAKKGLSFQSEYRFRTSEGATHWVLGQAKLELDENGVRVGYVGTTTEITERKQLEVQVRQQQKLQAMGTLASGVAHEINNPITGIMNYAQLIDERLDPESPLREFSGAIGRETKRVAGIVRNLLAFARQERETHNPANIAEIVNDTLSLIRTIIRRDQIRLDVDIPTDCPKITCHSQQIQQVMMNLLTNARDSLNARYPEHDPDKIIAVTVRQFEKEGRPWMRTTVEDHGVGVPDEIGDRLFDPFFTTKDRSHGTGLGLSISHGIVQDHHGELSYECEADRYTRFHLDLPLDNGWSLDKEPEGTE